MNKIDFILQNEDLWNSLSSKEQELLRKWDLRDHGYIYSLSFKGTEFKPYLVEEFLSQLFSSPIIKKINRSGEIIPTQFKEITQVHYKQLQCTIHSLDFFNSLKNHGILRNNLNISKCFDIFLENGVTVSDKLRALMLCDKETLASECDKWEDPFNENEKQEFIYHIFRRLTAGGALTQYEDSAEPYLEMTKALYKKLLSVQKHHMTEEPVVTSYVYEIFNIWDQSNISSLFPHREDEYLKQENSFCYVIIEPKEKKVIVWYNSFTSSF
eukprot:gb/GECH01001419.1/.p1 GENE.gb/GECH01001419.1/~~gb/GECH01001419.1/.p1  ORF type:complete len:269 (+),score=82.79 gb/GECH01001419.1/:1-807(+)